jgi:glyoxylase-like metal-dependent hydrolase (beta-lactamase superfamily II)
MLLTYGGEHTGSDAFLYLPDERIAYLADLLFIQVQPWLPDGDPEEWVRILERIEALDIATAIPGHGPLRSALGSSAPLRSAPVRSGRFSGPCLRHRVAQPISLREHADEGVARDMYTGRRIKERLACLRLVASSPHL